MADYAVEKYSLSIKNIKKLSEPSGKSKSKANGYEDLELSKMGDDYQVILAGNEKLISILADEQKITMKDLKTKDDTKSLGSFPHSTVAKN